MQSTSRESLARLRTELDGVAAGPADLPALAGDLYAVSNLLSGQARLRRLLSDPASATAQRTSTVSALLTGKIGAQALGLVSSAVTARWSASYDLVDGLVELGNEALFASAEKSGSLTGVEDELFRLGRILDGEPSLASLLDDQAEPIERRTGLLDSLIAGKVQPTTAQLVNQALGQRRRGFALQIENLADDAARRQGRSIAQVRSAVPLSDAQETRLAELLTETYGRAIGVRTEVDPHVRGGLVIRVGDELIDGSVATRLAAVRAALART